jgi:Flp pilus assembly pilin Flp
MLKQFLKDEQGQTTVEYLLIIAVVVVVISVLGKQMQAKIGELTNNIFGQINSTVTGIMKGAAR